MPKSRIGPWCIGVDDDRDVQELDGVSSPLSRPGEFFVYENSGNKEAEKKGNKLAKFNNKSS